MINDGVITLEQKDDILTWRPESDVLTNFLVAFMVTVIAYQITAIFESLLFGIKKYGMSPLSDIQILQHMRRASPLTAFQTLLQKPAENVNSHANQRSTIDDHDNSSRKLRLSVSLKLLFTLIMAPLINVLSIVLTMEYNATLNFSEARFTPIGLGIREHSISTPKQQLASTCTKTDTNFGRTSDSLVEFVICNNVVPLTALAASGKPSASVIFNASLRENTILLVTPKRTVYVWSVAQIVKLPSEYGGEKTRSFISRRSTSKQAAMNMVNDVSHMLRKGCNTTEEVEVKGPLDTPEGFSFSTAPFKCTPDSSDNDEEGDWLDPIINEFRSRMVFVKADKLRVDEEIGAGSLYLEDVSMDDVPLVREKRMYVSFLLLLIISITTIIIRIFVKYFTREDLSKGIGLLLRESLDLRCCDSMLSEVNSILYYDNYFD